MSVFGTPQQTSSVPSPVFSSPFGSSFFASSAVQNAQRSSLPPPTSPVLPQHNQPAVGGGAAVFQCAAGGRASFGAQSTSGVAPSASVLPSAAAPLFSSVFPQSVFQRASEGGNARRLQQPPAVGALRNNSGVLDAAASPSAYSNQTVPQTFNTKRAGGKRARSNVTVASAGKNVIGTAATAQSPSPSFVSGPVWQTRKQQEQRQLLSPFAAAVDAANFNQQKGIVKAKTLTDATVAAKEQFLSTRVFAVFMQKIMDSNEAVREEAAEHLEDAFFGVVGSHGGGGDFATALQQMLIVWQTLKKKHSNLLLKGEYWVALFALGCHLNFVTSVILSGEAEQESSCAEQRAILLKNKWAALTHSCTHANLMCDIMLQLFSNQSENHVPYSVLPFILRRVRNTFDLANDQGVHSTQPNIKTALLKLHRYVRVPLLQREPQSVVERQRVAVFACVLGEMMLYFCAPLDSGNFIQSFHEHCSGMVKIRCTLYHHHAHKLLQEPLTDDIITQAMELFARAFVIAPEDPKENKRLLFVKLAACGLALGCVPSLEDREKYNITELEDLIVAVQSSNMQLFNIAMRNNSEIYVQCGIHNVLQVVGKRISLLMVVKYYANVLSDRLYVQNMIDYYKLPFTLEEGCHVWLLPLLVERRINGVIDSGVLVLSSANPFNEYSKDALIALATKNQTA